MAHIDTLEHKSLVHFASVPSQDSLCETCKTAAERNALFLPFQPLESGCQECRLRYLGVIHAIGKHDPSEVNSVILRKNLTMTRSRDSDIFINNLSVYFYTEIDQAKSSWPIVGVGRVVGPRKTTYLAIVQEWLRICRETHVNCRRNEHVKLPTRVLDVGIKASDHIKLREVSGTTGSYLALSHCWGGGIAIRTTQSNLDAYKTGIDFGCLPKTFQDAVTVTRNLGLRYLWIDALCIIQDSKDDWEKESGNMTDVYQNAYAVLGADKSDNPDGGFLENEEGSYDRKAVPVAVVDSEDTIIYARYQMLTHGNPCAVFDRVRDDFTKEEPLLQRTWTLQEQLLASRMVHFARKEIIWECDSALSCECMELDRGVSAENERLRYRAALTSHSADKFKVWYEIVDNVGCRNITKPSDLLPALSGLAQIFQRHGAGPYLAGIWRDDLPRGLLWRTHYPPNSFRASPYRAPSWSWVSIQGDSASYTTIMHRSDVGLKHVYATVLEVECHPEGEDPCGAVDSGRIRISAPVFEMVYRGSYWLEPLHEASDTPNVTCGHFDFEFIPDQDEVLPCLIIAEVLVGPPNIQCEGLILRRRQDRSDPTFERVGLFKIKPEALQKIAGIITRKEVEII